MQGTMLVISPDGEVKRTALTAEPELETLQDAVGGWLEQVPYFLTMETLDGLQPCIAFCNEEGKLSRPKPLPVNELATAHWAAAQTRAGVDLDDVLVGNIVVIYGDEILRAMRDDDAE
jgi:hypothetical protein